MNLELNNLNEKYYYNDKRYTEECRNGNFSNAFALLDDYKIPTASFLFALFNDDKVNTQLKEKMREKSYPKKLGMKRSEDWIIYI